jgi:hypothetical protein
MRLLVKIPAEVAVAGGWVTENNSCINTSLPLLRTTAAESQYIIPTALAE